MPTAAVTPQGLETFNAKLTDSQVLGTTCCDCDETSSGPIKGYVELRTRGARLQRTGQGLWVFMAQSAKGRQSSNAIDREDSIGVIAMVGPSRAPLYGVIQNASSGHLKTRYRGLAKNRAQLFTLFASATCSLVRKKSDGMRTSLPPKDPPNRRRSGP